MNHMEPLPEVPGVREQLEEAHTVLCQIQQSLVQGRTWEADQICRKTLAAWPKIAAQKPAVATDAKEFAAQLTALLDASVRVIPALKKFNDEFAVLIATRDSRIQEEAAKPWRELALRLWYFMVTAAAGNVVLKNSAGEEMTAVQALAACAELFAGEQSDPNQALNSLWDQAEKQIEADCALLSESQS